MSLNSQPKIRFTPKMLNQKAKKAQPTQEMLDLGIQNSSDSAFFNLPGDIRKRIYEFAFTTGEVIQLLPLDADLEGAAITEAEVDETMEMDVDIEDMMMGLEINDTSHSDDTKPQTRNPFAAILASRQFYLETHLLPFCHNTIYCANIGDLATILCRLSPAQASSIRSLKIQWATALLAVQEYMDLSWASGMDPESVRSALQMLDKLEEVVVDWAGKRRIFLNKKRVEEALNALCGRKISVSFERGGEEYQEVVQRVGTVQQRKRMERADTAMEWSARAWDA
ncbi:uncharacterized protein J4E84_006233 [Alternaria hordeiaustralica]|uniref:uncharacterized protein n=1 Tax=Alternaria hordeiaustralica TaxID=1187925 RepID=UPI0020C2AF8E|nr:uncharacterized protein J4E84_006233 [Alternaria hordeiaustralica]KAI4685505.1 hypothetical protein J4E84_006233 [Alternaria hordeiaustralica]